MSAPTYQDRRFPDQAAYLPCLDACGEASPIVDVLCDQTWVRRAIEFMDRWDQKPVIFGACYVIGLDGLDRCKIGFSTNPAKRIRQIEIGLWESVKCHALFWSSARAGQGIELLALRKAKALGLRLKGEWVAMSGTDAAALVLDAVEQYGFTDSRTFLEQWVPNGADQSEARRAVSLDAYYEWGMAKAG